MIDIKKIIIIISLAFSFIGIKAQNSDKVSVPASRAKKLAKNAIRIGDIYSAIDYYKAYVDAKPMNYKAQYELAELYRRSRNYEQAKKYYKNAYEANGIKFVKALYYYALMEKMTGNYKDALDDFKKFRKKSKILKKDKRLYKKYVRNEILGCQIAKQLMDSDINVLITHLDTSINKAHIEFSPFPFKKDKFIFASLRQEKLKYYNPNDTTKPLPVRNFYIAKKYGQKWKELKKIDAPFNNPKNNVGNGCFSPDGTKFYYTKTIKNWRNEMISQIYVSKYENGKWSEGEPLPEPVNNPLYTTTQPSVGLESKHGYEVLYFVSDRLGTKGGLDIWYTVFNTRKNKFTKPKTVGSKINTVSDEMTPYYDMDTRTLYFSSNGHPGLGGLDIFKTTGELRKWEVPKNIGYPINTSTDDLYFTIGKNREEGFFTSNRKGGVVLKNPTCCDDIYSYQWTKYIHVAIKGITFAKEKIKYLDSIKTIIDSVTVKYDTLTREKNITKELNGTKISLFIKTKTDSLYEYLFAKSFTTSEKGKYFLNLEQGRDYKIVAEKDGYFNGQYIFSTKSVQKSDTLIKDIELKKIPMKAIVLNNIYYEFDKSELTNDAKLTIDTTIYKILSENEKLIVEISSHTDNKGNDKYNLKLSQKRAESVVDYLISKGIDKKRLIAKGYGETKPIAPNTNPDGSDNPEGRQANRRTEFKVIGSSDQFSKINYGGTYVNGKKVKINE